MDANSLAAARLLSASKSYKSALQCRSEMFTGFDEMETADDIREEYICPFCSDYFDILGLCCHIDVEHPIEAKNGVCPVCTMRVGVDMVAHITLQHGNIFKMHRRSKSRKSGSLSALSVLRRELREGNLQSLFGGSASLVSSGNVAPYPLLTSFVLPVAEDFEAVPVQSSPESIPGTKDTSNNLSRRKVQQPPLSIKDKVEQTKRCDFVQGVLLSMMLDDNL